VLKGESKYHHLVTNSHDVLAAIVLIWENIGDKASIIIRFPGLLGDIFEFRSRSATQANRATVNIVSFPDRASNR
jgi:hypothetical protein